MSRLLDPDTPPVGRAPNPMYITPSKPQLWYGRWLEGHRFTAQQENALIREGIDILNAEAMTVKRQATAKEAYWNIGSLPPVFAFECPVLMKRADGRVKVIAPDGSSKIVLPDGWAHRPYRKGKVAW